MKFVRGLRLSLKSAMSMVHCATFEEVVGRTLEGEAAHHIQHMSTKDSLPRHNLDRGTVAEVTISRELQEVLD